MATQIVVMDYNNTVKTRVTSNNQSYKIRFR